MASAIGSKRCDVRSGLATGLDRLGSAPAGPAVGRATGRPTVLNRTPESFKTDVAAQGGDAKPSLAESARRFGELLKGWSRPVREIFSRGRNESQIGLEPQPPDDAAFAKR